MSDETATAEAPASVDATDAPVTAPVEAPVTETSLDDELGAVFDKYNSEDSDEGDGQQPERPRGPDGKFAKRDGDTAAEESSETESADQPEEAAADTEIPSVEPPMSWPAEMVEKFNALPAEVRDFKEFVAQRDKEQGDAIARIGQSVQAVETELMKFEPLDQVMKAYQQSFERRGIQPAQAFAYLLNAQQMLDENPLAGIVQIGRSYNIDLVPLLQSAGVQVPQLQQAPRVDPNVADMQAKLQQLESKLSAQEQQEDQAKNQRLNTSIAQFAKDHPHLDDVRQIMSAIVKEGLAGDPEVLPAEQVLATAYDMAINASPQVRERIQSEQRKAAEAKRMAEQKAKAEAARKSTAVNVKSGVVNSASPKTMNETIEETARRLFA